MSTSVHGLKKLHEEMLDPRGRRDVGPALAALLHAAEHVVLDLDVPGEVVSPVWIPLGPPTRRRRRLKLETVGNGSRLVVVGVSAARIEIAGLEVTMRYRPVPTASGSSAPRATSFP